jgi:CHAT domain-containing protein
MPTGRESASQAGAIPEAGLLRGFRDFDLRRLPGAEKEGRTLRDRAADFGFARAELRLGKDASEAALYRVQSPPVLHLATHGFIFPEDSGTTPSTNSALRGDSGRSSFSNPMIRSGLALAGARQTIDAWARGRSVPAGNDGIVTAEEIGCLQLRGTRLVVLSACDTGLGKARAGEGVLGLRRGFVQAGAQNLLLTLWPIDDDRTAGFMPELYAEMNRSGDVVESLATVQRAWLRRLRLKMGIAEACQIAGPFILSFQGKPGASPVTVSSPATASAESASTDPERFAK